LVDRLVARKAWAGAEGLHACCDARTLLLARLVPVISFNLINYAAGVLGVGWWRFLWTTSLGILPITVASVALGNQLMGPMWNVWLAGSGLLLALYLGWRWYSARRLRDPRRPAHDQPACRADSRCDRRPPRSEAVFSANKTTVVNRI
jgi:uncharacterized membrane protein YdjX (TVP38/TMEM64 family)